MSKKKDIIFLIFILNFIFIKSFGQEQQFNNHLYSEGGSYSTQQEYNDDKSSTSSIDEELGNIEQEEYEQPNIYQTKSFPLSQEDRQRQRLANIIEQLQQKNNYYNSESTPLYFDENNNDENDESFLNDEQQPHLRNRNLKELNELKNLGMTLKQINDENENNDNEEINKMNKPIKKGQNEFVEFVEPINDQNNKRIKDIEWMEKRFPINSENRENEGKRGYFHFFNASGNILFIAYLTICCVGVVAGTVGGVYYYNHIRSTNVDDPFNEFTRYSPSGPGKDKIKKSGGGIQTFGGQNIVGDDTLAYKAQLQQYQQQKQKILGTGPTMSSNDQMSDNEEENDELEHNFSVFECPGLAPTGDVEIQNPNFIGENNITTKNDENIKKDEGHD